MPVHFMVDWFFVSTALLWPRLAGAKPYLKWKFVMSTKNYLLVLGLAALVSACGGGSPSEGTQGGNGNGGGAVETADKTKIKLDAIVQSQYCSYGAERPLSDVSVILHNADGKIHSRYTTDAKGHFEINWPAGVTHVTAHWKTKYNQHFLKTEIAPAHGDLGKIGFMDDDSSSCNCKTITIDSGDLRTAMPEYKVHRNYASGVVSGRMSATLQPLKLCADASNKFSVLQLMLAPNNSGPSYSREIDVSSLADQSTIKLAIGDFKQHGRALNLTSNLPIANSSAYTASPTGRDFYFRSTVGIDGPQRLFERGSQPQYVYAASSTTDNTPQGSLFYLSSRRLNVDPAASTVDVQLPDNKTPLTLRIQQLMSDVLAHKATSVDFSGYSRYQTLAMYVAGDNFSWSLHGGAKMTIPQLELPAAIQSDLNNGTKPSFQLQLSALNPAWSLGTIQQKQATRSRGQATPEQVAELSTWSMELLDVTINP